jgi:hypothetical protein
MPDKYIEQLWSMQNGIVFFAAGQLLTAIFAISQHRGMVAGAVKWRRWVYLVVVLAHVAFAAGIYFLGQQEQALAKGELAGAASTMMWTRMGGIAALLALALAFFAMLG